MIKLSGCVIYDNKGRILLIHRKTEAIIHWELPGGKIEEGELPEESAKRECEEELGVKIKVISLLGQKPFKYKSEKIPYYWYEAKIIEGKPKPVEEKHDEVRYFSLGELKGRQELSANVVNLIQELN